MKAKQILRGEHRVIEEVLDALENQILNLQAGRTVRIEFFLDAADFIRNFADGCHHRKEEGVLFPAMVAAGLQKDSGPVAVMLAEHEQVRVFTRAFAAAAVRYQRGKTSAAKDVIRNSQDYVSLLRQHIQKEDGVLFPMADRVIPLESRERVAEEFDRVEREETGAGVHEKYHALAEKLAHEASG
jgi:hemerythrin-like domain-containing protein